MTMKLHYKTPQRQLSQGCTIFIDSIVLFISIMWKFANYAIGCDFDQLCRIAPSHFIRGLIEGHGIVQMLFPGPK